MDEALLKYANAKHTEQVSALRAKKLDNAYVKLNKARTMIDTRDKRQSEHDLFRREDFAQM